jgi:hypothetical protein
MVEKRVLKRQEGALQNVNIVIIVGTAPRILMLSVGRLKEQMLVPWLKVTEKLFTVWCVGK